MAESQNKEVADSIAVLRAASRKWEDLQKEAKDALNAKDCEAYEAKLIEATQLIVDLPTRVKGLPRDVFSDLVHLAMFAKETLEEDNLFGMGSFLHKRGAKVGDPNILDNFIEKL